MHALYLSRYENNEAAIDFVKNYQMNNFSLLNSPGIYALLTYLRENKNGGVDEELLKSAREC